VLADALKGNRGDPGQEHVDEHDQRIASAQRTVGALNLLEERRFEEVCNEEVCKAFDEHADELAANTREISVCAARRQAPTALHRVAGRGDRDAAAAGGLRDPKCRDVGAPTAASGA